MAFSVLGNIHKRVIRAPINPLDKSTIFSIFPSQIDEKKVTIQPGRFIIEPGSFEKPSSLVVGPSSWWKELDQDQPALEIPVSSIQVADSVVKDYCNGVLECNMGDRMPGLFFLPGEITVAVLKAQHSELLIKANIRQKNWYEALVKMADVLWARSGGNPIAIDDRMRMAARELQMKEKPWMTNFVHSELSNCPACGTMRNSNFPVCANCKSVIDPEKFKQLGMKFAS